MTAVVFIGPTISHAEAGEILDAIYMPPVMYGDVYKVADQIKPDFIAIVDGYFNQVPSVWHKEVLWAMQNGISVMGAASMGALRAAELDMFGMIGIGRVYEAYRDSIMLPFANEAFEDDDEVAVIHAPAELGYKSLSEAMVNIRATLALATEKSVIQESTRDGLVARFKKLFYPDRCYDKLTDASFVTQSKEIIELNTWLPENKVDLKNVDARRLLTQLAEFQSKESSSGTFTQTTLEPLEITTLWETAADEFEYVAPIDNPVLTELRLQGEPYLRLRNEVEAEFTAHTQPPINDLISNGHEILEREEWMTKAYAFKNSYASVCSQHPNVSQRHIIRKLEESGLDEALELRAQQKKEKLNLSQLAQITETFSDIERLQLAEWYFEQHLQSRLPDDLDAYRSDMDFQDEYAFYTALYTEYEFCAG